MAEQKPLSLRACAKILGVSPEAVSQAVKSGRLRACVVRDHRDQPKISDVEVAKREWAARTDLSRAPGYVRERAERRAGGIERRPGLEGVDVPDELSLSEESAREKHWKARIAELDFRERAGELVDATEMEAHIADAFTKVRTRLLGVPTRAKQQLPHLAAGDIAVLDRLLREALEALVLEMDQPEMQEAVGA